MKNWTEKGERVDVQANALSLFCMNKVPTCVSNIFAVGFGGWDCLAKKLCQVGDRCQNKMQPS